MTDSYVPDTSQRIRADEVSIREREVDADDPHDTYVLEGLIFASSSFELYTLQSFRV